MSGVSRSASISLGLLLWSACRRESNEPIATGTVEVVEVDAAPMTPARIMKIWVREGDEVAIGDTLVSLTQATLRSDIEGRRARLSAAEAGLRDLAAGARAPQIESAEAELRFAEAEATRTASDVTRFTPLAKDGSISDRQFETIVTAAATAAARRDAARENLQLIRAGARPEQLRGARAEVENARAALASSLATASDLMLTASIAGTVTARHAEPGEILAAGEPVLTIGDARAPWARVYVDQRLLPLLRVGDSVTAVLDGFPDHQFAGRIAALSDRAEFTPRVALTEDERADLLFGVKVEFSDSTGMLKAGLPITVRFNPRAPGVDAP